MDRRVDGWVGVNMCALVSVPSFSHLVGSNEPSTNTDTTATPSNHFLQSLSHIFVTLAWYSPRCCHCILFHPPRGITRLTTTPIPFNR